MKNQKIFQILEFQKIRDKIAAYCLTPIGNELVLNLNPSHQRDEIIQKQEESYEAYQIIQDNLTIPVPRLKALNYAIKRLELGASLNGEEIATMGKLLKSVSEIRRFFLTLEKEEKVYPALSVWNDKLVSLPETLQLIQSAIDEDGSVISTASKELSTIRRKQLQTENQVRSQLNQILKSKAKQLSDQLITIRNDRYVLPVKTEYRYQFGGTVHDQSSSGQTLYIEPQSIVSLNNQRAELQNAERKEIERILLEISQQMMPYSQEIQSNQYAVGQFDFIQARALYGQEINGIKPEFSEQQHIAIWQARHPLIDPQKVVANDIVIGDQYKSLIITGPNTGGKTILLKTLGIIQMMGQSGLLVPCDFGSQLGIFDHVFADIGDEQSIEQNLSTFSGHMTNIIEILSEMTAQSLILFDELGSGTDPQEGASLAMSILDYVRAKGAIVMASTHYPELKLYAHQTTNTINASMEFDSDTLSPTYRLLIGIPGRSNAFDISEKLGLPHEILKKARQGVSQDAHSVNEMVANLERERREAELNHYKTNQLLEEAEKLHQDLTTEYQRFMDTREERLSKVTEEANQKVALAQEQAEQILQEIRDLQLEQGHQKPIKEHVLIDKRRQFEDLKQPEHLRKNKVLKKAKLNRRLKVGDDVEVLTYGQRGTIIQVENQNEYIVQMGILKMKLKLDELSPLDKIENKVNVSIQRNTGEKVLTTLDLRGRRYDDAMNQTKHYLDKALISHHPMVTIIHGKGTGALREGIQSLLKKHPQVDRFEFAAPNNGGNGATVVYFK